MDPTPTDPDPVDPTPTGPDPVDPTPTGPDPVDPTPTDPDPVDPTPTDPDPVDPTPTDPDPVDPTPTDPDPVDPTPTDPDPVDPTPTDPDPVDPTPTDPDPVDPTPTDPDPVDPTPTDPDPVDPTPTDPDPVDPTPTDPDPVDPTPTDPDPVDPTPTDPDPVDPTPTDPDPVDPAPTDPDPSDPSVNTAPGAPALDNTSVAENAAGAVIGAVTASDPEGDALSYTVDDARFEVTGGVLKLKDGISLDHEAEPSVTVTVTATDPGGLSSSGTFSLTVGDVNEAPGAPALDNASVAENAAGAVIGAVSASDPEGDALSYTVDDARFEVTGGVLKLKDGISLDHEAEPSVTVTVTATDPGGLSSSGTFSLTVGDVNEAPGAPALDNASVAENAAGAVIGAVSASDPEGDALSYTVDDARFEVTGGVLKLKDGISLDHEAEPSVTVTVTATDPGGLSSSGTFSLTVGDVNEAPGAPALDNASVAENAAGAVIGAVSASDPEGDALSYTVDDARFEVTGGVLKLKDGISLDHEAEPSVTVTVTATDPGGLSSSGTFSLTVEDVNEAPGAPALDNASVAENAAGAVIGAVSASDPEGDALSYTVDDARFEVTGGVLKLKDGISLDHEAEPSVTVTVTATDPGGLSSSGTFSLTVGDVAVPPAAVTVSTSFHVEQIAVADGVLGILGVDFGSDPLGDFYTETIDFPSTPFSFFDVASTDVFATRVTGRIQVDDPGNYEFRLTSGDTVVMWIDGDPVVINAVEGLATVQIGACNMGAGEHEIVIHHLDLNGDAEMTLEWRGPGETDFSLVTPSPAGTIEDDDDAGFIVDIDTGTSALLTVKLTDVPDNWVISSDGNAGIPAGGELDVTGWDLSQLTIAPASGDLGPATINVETTLQAPDGEVETSSSSFDVNVVPENGIVLDLDLGLGGLPLPLGLGVQLAAQPVFPGEVPAEPAVDEPLEMAAQPLAAQLDPGGVQVLF
ncbi:PA14 domain-containing protein [Leisingera sp. NJS201]|uniref:PA14 domain-containing protein n=2 Tax=unclassified Leisingera TaxID=2614906 RepID=UPI001430E190|nr:PA14 domain-containing protein [Leisingera sp. NJS201]